MIRGNDITDRQLKDFCELFFQRFRTRKVRLEWFAISLLGATHVPKRDLKDLLKRATALALVRMDKNFVESIKN